jgi:16S rRNA (guanine527-N7)-methyltransferase
LSILKNYFPDLSERQYQQFDKLTKLYPEWNEKINVISRKDIDQLTVNHVLHSLAIAKVTPLNEAKTVLDVGTGGGFPGIPLAIIYPQIQFTLVDSIGKKISVVQDVAKSLELENITAIHCRVEKVKGKFDVVVTRAVARTKKLVHWVHTKIDPSSTHMYTGIVALKGGDLEEEMAEIKRNYVENKISEIFKEPFFETKKVIFIPF